MSFRKWWQRSWNRELLKNIRSMRRWQSWSIWKRTMLTKSPPWTRDLATRKFLSHVNMCQLKLLSPNSHQFYQLRRASGPQSTAKEQTELLKQLRRTWRSRIPLASAWLTARSKTGCIKNSKVQKAPATVNQETAMRSQQMPRSNTLSEAWGRSCKVSPKALANEQINERVN